ncbi:uncharacterized protein C1orf100 homolog [Rhinatrema bivittatum]|uniref:uncharacterized protein C1orf100 homolog n=1 Tax=Rhinatrema bivittatum TaxID=194408 RepID=UPI001127B8E7|nr:uncharacterized protein C1orf100 homolog [Rhinatrema bivittatum]
MAGPATSIKLREFKASIDSLSLGTVPRQGKDVRGLYPGQLGRIHKAHITETTTGLCPFPEESHYQHDFDFLTLELSHRDVKRATNNVQTTYQEAFSLSFYKFDNGIHKYTPVTHNGPLRKLSAQEKQRIFCTHENTVDLGQRNEHHSSKNTIL